LPVVRFPSLPEFHQEAALVVLHCCLVARALVLQSVAPSR
jgi:hypothetical protein